MDTLTQNRILTMAELNALAEPADDFGGRHVRFARVITVATRLTRTTAVYRWPNVTYYPTGDGEFLFGYGSTMSHTIEGDAPVLLEDVQTASDEVREAFRVRLQEFWGR
jgi:hypothetical protein